MLTSSIGLAVSAINVKRWFKTAISMTPLRGFGGDSAINPKLPATRQVIIYFMMLYVVLNKYTENKTHSIFTEYQTPFGMERRLKGKHIINRANPC
ncbi:hypothetical protein D3C86_1491640 [compost metagenome]